MKTKKCSKCNNLYPENLEYFSIQRCTKNGKEYIYYSSWCRECKRKYDKEQYHCDAVLRNKKIEYSKEYHKSHRDKKRRQSRLYSKTEIAREKNRTNSKKYREKNKTNPMHKLAHSMSQGIYDSLKENKKGMHWETLVNYNIKDLRKHLESQFVEGMSWDNYGKWHIDHIIPLSSFHFISPTDLEFRMCWDIRNLQPLWAFDNISKNNKL